MKNVKNITCGNTTSPGDRILVPKSSRGPQELPRFPSPYPYFVSTHRFWMTTDKQRMIPTATVPQINPRATTKVSAFPEAGVEEGAEVINPKKISH